MTCGYLFVNSVKICDVAELTEIDTLCDDESVDKVVGFINTEEMSIDISFKTDRKSVLSLVHGRHVTNNWLKMHGGIMSRKGLSRKKHVLL